uniref:Uncharacterized protein n=1 Tax=viral metagenome TaxID=1070528 RepID=A0A6C0EH48_9ZZZZ
MSDENLDLNVNNYTIKDLLDILDLNDYNDDSDNNDSDILQQISKEDILNATQNYINKFSNENNEEMVNFFQEIQNKLLNIKDEDYSDDTLNVNSQNNIQNNSLVDIQKDIQNSLKNEITNGTINFNRYSNEPNQLHKGTDGYDIINPETLHVVNTFAPSEVRGNINPLLKNTYSCFINIDSKYRQFTNNNSDTKFTLDLSAPLKNLLSLQLYSYQIPISWYVINSNIGNTCFWIEDPSTNTVVSVSISPGNYTPDSLVKELNTKILDAGFHDFPTTPFTYDIGKGKIILKLFGGIYRKLGVDIFTISTTTQIIFFDFDLKLECNIPTCGFKLPTYINNTLGWILGFRTDSVNVNIIENIPPALLDINGPRYLILVIDDFKQNHINNNLISITEYDNNLKIPSYYNPNLPHSCVNPSNNSNSIRNIVNEDINASNTILNKLDIKLSKIPNILPSNPRILTQSQIYTINQIIKNNKKNGHFYPKAPTNQDVFAIIPIKNGVFNSIITEFSGSLSQNQRMYFGPTDVSRLEISLYDDTGNIVDLNGVSWSFTMQATCLYQY